MARALVWSAAAAAVRLGVKLEPQEESSGRGQQLRLQQRRRTPVHPLCTDGALESKDPLRGQAHQRGATRSDRACSRVQQGVVGCRSGAPQAAVAPAARRQQEDETLNPKPCSRMERSRLQAAVVCPGSSGRGPYGEELEVWCGVQAGVRVRRWGGVGWGTPGGGKRSAGQRQMRSVSNKHNDEPCQQAPAPTHPRSCGRRCI